MSLCPYHLLRPRADVGLSYISRHRLRLGPLRQAKISPYPARFIAIHGSPSVSVSGTDGGLSHNDHEPSATPPPSLSKSHPPSQSNFSGEVRTRDENDQEWHPVSFPGRSRHSPMFELENGRGVEVDGVPMVYLGCQPRGDYGPLMKALAPGAIEEENKIRARGLLFRDIEELRQWKADFLTIRAHRLKGRPLHRLYSRCLELDDGSYRLFETLSMDGLSGFRLAWERLTKEEKSAHWPRLSLYLIYNAPDLAWLFLYVTCLSENRPMFRMTWYLLDFLEKQSSEEVMRTGVGGITFDVLVSTVLDPEHWPIIFPPQRGLRRYIKNATHEELRRAYNLALERRHNLRAQTWLCFMYHFTRYGDIETALEALAQLPKLQQEGFVLGDVEVQRHCCKLLLQDRVVDEPDGRNFYILPKLLQMGIRPGRDMMNVVLANAFKTDNPQLGHNMFEYMKAQGHEADGYTYLSLLGDAVKRGDLRRLDELSAAIRSRPELFRNPYIASKLMHARFVFTVKTADGKVPASTVFYSLLEMYNELYDLTPLKELTILPTHYTPAEPGENNPPSPIALHLMMSTYIRCQKQLPILGRLYAKFRSLSKVGHPTITPMLKTSHICHEFLAAFRRVPHGLRSAMLVVEHMLQSAEGRPVHAGPDGPAIQPARPSVWTWNLLLSTFLYHRQPYAVERVREMMAAHNVKYDPYTWNILINSHVTSQNIPALAQTIKDMEGQGFDFDDYTMKALSYLRDPERLWMAVKELDEASDPSVRQVDFDLPDSPATEADEAREFDDEEGLLVQGLKRLVREDPTRTS